MAYLCTIIKLRADCEFDAIKKANRIITDNWSFRDIGPFYSVNPDATKVLGPDEFDEERFNALRNNEIGQHNSYLSIALAIPENERTTRWTYASNLSRAANCIDSTNVFCRERNVFDAIQEETDDCADGEHIYYVQTDRHY